MHLGNLIVNLFNFHKFAVDIISAIEFDKSGDHLATGDRGGRVVLFERTDTKEVICCICLLCDNLSLKIIGKLLYYLHFLISISNHKFLF